MCVCVCVLIVFRLMSDIGEMSWLKALFPLPPSLPPAMYATHIKSHCNSNNKKKQQKNVEHTYNEQIQKEKIRRIFEWENVTARNNSVVHTQIHAHTEWNTFAFGRLGRMLCVQIAWPHDYTQYTPRYSLSIAWPIRLKHNQFIMS